MIGEVLRIINRKVFDKESGIRDFRRLQSLPVMVLSECSYGHSEIIKRVCLTSCLEEITIC